MAYEELIRFHFAEPRPDWNCLAPKMPAWFRRGLKRIDRRLTLQYFPPNGQAHPDGINARRFPFGVWVICRKLRNTRLLCKQWVWSLVNEWGVPQYPTYQTLRLIGMAHRYWMAGKESKLYQAMDQASYGMMNALHARQRASLVDVFVAAARRLGVRTMPNRVSFATGNAANKNGRIS